MGSKLIGQPFKRDAARGPGLERDPAYFQPRPSVTGYSGDVTFFNNLGPNSLALSRFFANKAEAYVAREGRYDPGLTVADVPVDAVTTSASGRRPADLRGERPDPGEPGRRGPRAAARPGARARRRQHDRQGAWEFSASRA